jgi:hypothetical protein
MERCKEGKVVANHVFPISNVEIFNLGMSCYDTTLFMPSSGKFLQVVVICIVYYWLVIIFKLLLLLLLFYYFIMEHKSVSDSYDGELEDISVDESDSDTSV